MVMSSKKSEEPSENLVLSLTANLDSVLKFH